MPKEIRRGYVDQDERQFSKEALCQLRKAAEEVVYLINHGYPIKQVTTFIGNHYMFSERQRLALTRSISTEEAIQIRTKKLLQGSQLNGRTVHVDGFNTIITLEVALSGSLVLLCQDGCIRDLAGLRGTYRIIGQTKTAIHLLLSELEKWKVAEAVIYLDQPVSNSGRLSQLIKQVAEEYSIMVETDIRSDVDSVLETKENVITSDAIILNKCLSWINLNRGIIDNLGESAWKVRV